jgi:hypothetical protein
MANRISTSLALPLFAGARSSHSMIGQYMLYFSSQSGLSDSQDRWIYGVQQNIFKFPSSVYLATSAAVQLADRIYCSLPIPGELSSRSLLDSAFALHRLHAHRSHLARYAADHPLMPR